MVYVHSVVAAALMLRLSPAQSQSPKQWIAGNLSLTAQKIEIDLLNETLAATGACRLVKGQDVVLTANSITGKMQGNEDIGEVKARDQVKIVYKHRDEKGALMDVVGESSSASWQSGDKEAISLVGSARLEVQGSEPATLTADKIDVDLQGSAFSASGSCRLEARDGEITGNQMDGTIGSQGADKLTTTGNARIVYTLKDSGEGSRKLRGASSRIVWVAGKGTKGKVLLDGNAEVTLPQEGGSIELGAPMADISLDSNSFVATGGCRLRMQSGVMTGSRMEGKLTAGDQFELHTTGKVAVNTEIASGKGPARKVVAIGDRSVYRSADDSLVIDGNASLKVSGEGSEGANIRGDKIHINLRTKKVIIETDDPANPTQLDFRKGEGK